LDAKTQALIEGGKRIVELFKQLQYSPQPVETQVATLWAAQNKFLDDVPVEKVKDFQTKLTDFLTTRKAELMSRIAKQKAVDDALAADLKTAVTEFKQTYR
jgi:F-type H+-transporting ATPase subunit alpha